MFHTFLQLLAPNYCCGCGIIGTLLCQSCIKNIVSEPFLRCVSCARRPAGLVGVCSDCKVPYQRAWAVGIHESVLDATIDSYKFRAKRDGAQPLARLLSEAIPQLPSSVVLVPIPTARQHVRERGFDHMRLVATQLAQYKNVTCDTSLLRRRTSAVQREATAVGRKKQAKEMFRVAGRADSEQIYLLIDDVMTTGSTVKYAAKALQDAGATQVWVAVIARQMLS